MLNLINYSKGKNSFLHICLKTLNNLNKTKPKYKRYFLIIIDLLNTFLSFLVVNFLFNSNNNLSITTVPLMMIISVLVYTYTGQYNSLTRYLLTKEIFKIGIRNLIIIIGVVLLAFLFDFELSEFRTYIFLWIISTFFNVVTKFSLKEILDYVGFVQKKRERIVAIYGAGAAGAQLASSLLLAGNHKIKVFFDDSPNLWGRKLLGIKICSSKEIYKYDIDQILLAIPSLSKEKSQMILEKLKSYEIPVLKVPSIAELTSGKAKIDSLKSIEIDDLLGRIRVEPFQFLLESSSKNQNILITGAGGTIGREIFSQIFKLDFASIVLVENSEVSLYSLEQDYGPFLNKKKILFKLGDVKNYNFIKGIIDFYNVNVIYHAAAYKHVPLLESNALQGIENNIVSTYSICKASRNPNVKKVTLISSDKAVRPTNVMGATKRLAELIVIAFANNNNNIISTDEDLNEHKIKFSIVRFGNVLGSSGSVVPLFKKQIASGGPITLTDRNIIRYFMTVTEAAQLVIQATSMSKGGEIFLLDMGDPVRIEDLAKQMIRLSGLKVKNLANPNGDIEIISTGLRPGEKLYEELLIDGESESTIHPLIFKAKEKILDHKEIINGVEKLIEYINNQNEEECLDLLSKYVPEWKRSFNKKF